MADQFSDPAAALDATALPMNPVPSPKSCVFISYSRKDGAFAEKLHVGLLARGFDARLDMKDILKGEDWRARLESLILAADVVVFVLSPDSIARWDVPPPDEAVCAWEIRRTVELKKQLTPVLWRSLEGAKVPPELGKLNWVAFDAYERSKMRDETIFDEGLSHLETALRLREFLWIREHTKWVARAAEWDKEEPSRPEGKLLRAADIAAVEAWKSRRRPTAGEIPPVLEDFLAASIAKEQQDRATLLLTVGRAFVKPAEEALKNGRSDRAVRLAASGALLINDLDTGLVPELWPPAAHAIFEGRARAVLLNGHKHPVLSARFGPGGARIVTASFSPDGTQVVTSSGDPFSSVNADNTVRLWAASTGTEIVSLMGHEGVVHSSAFSPDGKQIVTASEDKTARLWDAATGKEIAQLIGHDGSVRAASFSPDGLRVVTASYDKTARLWEAATGREIAVLQGHGAGVEGASFSADGTRIVTASQDKTARLWEAATGREATALVGHHGRVVSASFSPDGARIVSVGDKTARVWEATTGREIALLTGHQGAVYSASFSPDGKRIVTASSDKTARLWVAATGQQLATLSGHDSWVHCASFSPDGARILTASSDNSARLWDAVTGVEFASLLGHDRRIISAFFSSDGTRVVTASEDETARLWDAATARNIAALSGHEKTVRGATFSPDGKRIATASEDKSARLWEISTGREIAPLVGHENSVNSVSFSPDSMRIVTASEDKTARLWVAATGREIAILAGHEKSVSSASFSPDGNRIVTASYDKTARLWDAATGREISSLAGHGDTVYGASFSPDGKHILTASGDNTARLWEMATGRAIASLVGHGDTVLTALFNPDGTRIVTASHDNTARLWDAATGQEITILQGHEGRVNSASFSSDGKRIVTASLDNTARIWEVATGREIASVEGQGDLLWSASFNPAGTQILTISGDNTASLWDVSRTAAIASDRAVVLTAALASGNGRRTGSEADDLLMQAAADDLYTEARRQLLDPEKHSATELVARERQLEETIAALNAPLHPNCYLSPTAFSEKFGLERLAVTSGSAETDDAHLAGAGPTQMSADLTNVAATKTFIPFDIATAPYEPHSDAKRLPAEASALAAVLKSTAISDLAVAYANADKTATRAQAQFARTNRWEVRSATAAAIIGALFLSPLGDIIDGEMRSVALGLQYLALLVSIILGLRASRVGALDSWRDARSHAEDQRTALFRGILKPDVTGALLWQLEYFVKGLFQPQLDYFERKTAQHRASLSKTSRWRWLGLSMLVLMGALVVFSAVPLLHTLGAPIPLWLLEIAAFAKPVDHPRVLLALGVIASTLQGVATMRAQISLSERNAERFAILAAQFKDFGQNGLPQARAAAATGDRGTVLALTESVMTELDAEARAWREVRGTVRPLRKMPWRRG